MTANIGEKQTHMNSTTPTPDKPLHIAFVLPGLYRYGTERVTLTIVQRMIECGHIVDMVLFKKHIHCPQWIPDKLRLFVVDDEPDQATESAADYEQLSARIDSIVPCSRGYGRLRLTRDMKWRILALSFKKKLQQAPIMANYIQRERPDIIFPGAPQVDAPTLMAGHLTGNTTPIVPILHSTAAKRHKRTQRRHRLLFPSAARVVAVSESVADSAVTEFDVPREKITTIYNPVVSLDLDRLKTQTPNHPWLSDNGPPVILACGRLKKAKDYPTLIKAFSLLSAQRPCRLIILGDGELMNQVEQLVQEFNLRQKVSLPGWTDNPFAFMFRSSLFALSSRVEGLGNVLIEALACGCPCVSTDSSGPTEILQGGKIGSLVPVGDHTALAGAMARTLDNPPDKRKLLDRADFFSVEKSVKMYENLILEILR